ncbi:MAG: YggS family pyridoxal phosphate-dependent enzyme [Acidimicrobiales bacterium]
MTIGAEQVRAGLGEVRERIVAAGGHPERITVVAVTKGFGVEAVEAAREAGATHVGENYAQELLAKAEAMAPGPAPLWHFIGGLQTNKVRQVAHLVDLWETVDRPSLGAEVAKRAPGARVLAQVNISGEATKSGCQPENTATLVSELRDLGLDVRGLMGVAAPGDDGRARAQFGRLAELAAALELAELSMGMSADLEAAVAEGSTIVRVGTALFGPRPPR